MSQHAERRDSSAVVLVLDSRFRDGDTVDRAAQEAARRGVGLALLPLAAATSGPASVDPRDAGWVRRTVADLARDWPEVPVEVVDPAEPATGSESVVGPSARLVVVDAAAGEACLRASGAADPVGRPGYPVLVAGPATHHHRARVVVAALTQDQADHGVVHRALDEAVARGCELRLVMSYPRSSGEPEPCAADRAHRYLDALLATEPRAADVEVTAVCTSSPLEHAVVLQAHATELLVAHRGGATGWLDALLRRPPTDVLVLPTAPDDPGGGLPPAYRRALEREALPGSHRGPATRGRRR